MKRFVLQIFVVLFFAGSISAQIDNQKNGLVDEFGKIGLEDLMARLDVFMYKLSQNSRGKGRIIVYGGDEKEFSRAYRRGSLFDAYLKNNRKFPPQNYSIDYCKINKGELRTEFYIVEPGGEIPECEENLEMPVNSVLWESVDFDDSKIEFTPLENIVIEHGVWDGIYSDVSIDRLEKLLNNSPQSKVYLITYLQTNFERDENGKIISGGAKKPDKKSLAAKMLLAAKNELLGKGFNASQIKTIDGGFVHDTRRLEFWLVPPGGEIPQPKPDYFPKKRSKK